MEGQNGNASPHKSKENGIKGKPPYSVETPYGFRLDLDFLKYVDDIEKGNTIKRVPIQRRTKGPRASTLPKHLNPSGCGYRPSLWASTGALGPRSRVSDDCPPNHSSPRTCDHRSPLSPTGLKSLAEMEARIKEFDEQPLGEHIRPHLLRASSMPLTVLLSQGSEAAEDHAGLRGFGDPLGGRNTSCEDVFSSPDSTRPRDCSGLLRRLTEALERVGELETEVRVIPELRAQICILQEERERLRLGLDTLVRSPAMNGTRGPRASSHYGTMDIKRPRHDSGLVYTKSQDDSSLTHEWRTSTDLDELLTVTSLQAKVAVLEQKLHESSLELQRAVGLLREQQDESRWKDEKTEHLIANPALRVRAERVVVDQDGDEAAVSSVDFVYGGARSSRSSDTFGGARTATANGQSTRQRESAEPGEASAVVVHHVNKIKRLLGQQWECLCADSESGEEGEPPKHRDPKVNSLQQEMMGLVDILSSYCAQHGQSNGERIQHGAPKSIMKTDGCLPTSENQHGVVNEGRKTSETDLFGEEGVNLRVNPSDWRQKESSSSPGEMAAAQVEPDTERRRMEEMSPETQMISEGTGPERTDGSTASVGESQERAKTKPKPPGGQTERHPGSETTPAGRMTVSADFMAACQFLNDHMENMDNPNDDMRKALVVLFQHWFSATAEEASVASRVTVYLGEVKKATPSLLAFLVNLADDNGNTVLHYSVSHCNYGIVTMLLDTGVSDVNLQNNAGYTAVMLASLTAPDGPGGMEVVRKIMELGNINIRSGQTGQTALHLAVRHGRVVMVRLLLSCGADTNIQDSQGTTALMFASERGHTHIARLLLERSQCDLSLTDKRGQTAILIALQGSHTDTAALLQAHAKARVL